MLGAHDLLASVRRYRERFPEEKDVTSLFIDLLSIDPLSADFLSADFLSADFLSTDFLSTDFLSTDFLSANPSSNKNSVFERSNFTPGHCTGSAWIVDPARDRVLLLHHKKLNKWLQPGGHADGDSDLFRVALREAQEESGLITIIGDIQSSDRIFDLDVHAIPAHKGEPEHLHFDVRYLFAADSTEPLKCSEESNELRWIESKDLATFSSEESLLRMHRKQLAQDRNDRTVDARKVTVD